MKCISSNARSRPWPGVRVSLANDIGPSCVSNLRHLTMASEAQVRHKRTCLSAASFATSESEASTCDSDSEYVLGKSLQGHIGIQKVLAQLTLHYEVMTSVICWNTQDSIEITSRAGSCRQYSLSPVPDFSQKPRFTLFRHHIDWHLPIIISDCSQHKHACNDPLVMRRFTDSLWLSSNYS